MKKKIELFWLKLFVPNTNEDQSYYIKSKRYSRIWQNRKKLNYSFNLCNFISIKNQNIYDK